MSEVFDLVIFDEASQCFSERGIPAIAVLDDAGSLLFSQKGGEFESARSLGPDDILAFLDKWKPSATKN